MISNTDTKPATHRDCNDRYFTDSEKMSGYLDAIEREGFAAVQGVVDVKDS
jgi:hypothetical protein